MTAQVAGNMKLAAQDDSGSPFPSPDERAKLLGIRASHGNAHLLRLRTGALRRV